MARRHPQVHAPAVAAGHGRRRALPRRAPLPLQRRGQPGHRRHVRRARRRATSSTMPSARRCGALCDTFIPSLEPPEGDEANRSFWRRAASHMAVPEGVEVALLQAGLADGADRGAPRRCSTSSPATGWPPAHPQEAREGIVTGFCEAEPGGARRHRDPARHRGTLFYALPDLGTGRNLNWDAIGFPGPLAPPPADRERPLRIRRPSAPEETIEADVCVVGSGAGGGVIAGELAAAGKSVVVLEAGEYHDDADFDGLELSAYQRMYLNGGPFPPPRARCRSSPARASAAARSSTGPTACAPSTTCGRSGPPSTGCPTSPSPEFDEHLDAVFERLGVNGDCSDLSGPTSGSRRPARSWATTSGRSPATPTPRRTRPRPPPTWASATHRARSSRRRRPTWWTRRPTAPRSSPAPARSGC